MKGEADLLKLYNDRYMEGIQTLKNVGEAKQVSDSNSAMIVVRRPVQ